VAGRLERQPPCVAGHLAASASLAALALAAAALVSPSQPALPPASGGS